MIEIDDRLPYNRGVSVTDNPGGIFSGMFGGDDDPQSMIGKMMQQMGRATASVGAASRANKIRSSLELQEVELSIAVALIEAGVAEADAAVCQSELKDELTDERRQLLELKVKQYLTIAAAKKRLAEGLQDLLEVKKELAELALADDPAGLLSMFGGGVQTPTPSDGKISGNASDPRHDTLPPAGDAKTE